MAQLSPRLQARLARVPDVARAAAAQAMEEGAEEVCEYIRNQVRSLFKQETGTMIRSIGWTWGEVPAGSFVIDEIRSGANKGDQYATLRIKIYAGAGGAFYYRFHEFGTKDGLPARPTFFPGWKKMRPKFRARIRAAVKTAIKEAWANG